MELKDIISAKEAGRIIGCNHSTVSNHIKQGLLKGGRVPGTKTNVTTRQWAMEYAPIYQRAQQKRRQASGEKLVKYWSSKPLLRGGQPPGRSDRPVQAALPVTDLSQIKFEQRNFFRTAEEKFDRLYTTQQVLRRTLDEVKETLMELATSPEGADGPGHGS